MAGMEEVLWVPFEQRPEWQGFSVRLGPAQSTPVVEISYSDQDAETLAYFYTVLEDGEKSLRALQLTKEVIDLNSANYSAWEWRWQCFTTLLPSMPELLAQELHFLHSIAEVNVKNYQLWNYRRRLALMRGPAHASEELAFAHGCLTEDAKNYHAWSHRAAVVRMSQSWADELAYTGSMLLEDVRNNSAWSQRFFVLSSWPGRLQDAAVVSSEAQYAADKLCMVPHNLSAWNYLVGLWKVSDRSPHVLQPCLALSIRVPEGIGYAQAASMLKQAHGHPPAP